MSKSVGRLALIMIIFFSKSALATTTTISSSSSTPVSLSSDSDELSLSGSGDLTVSTTTDAAVTGNGNDLVITVNPTSGSSGITATGSYGAIKITGSLATLSLSNGVISSATQTDGTVGIASTEISAPTITLSSGTSITNSNSAGYGIFSNSTFNTSLTIDNAGTISTNNDASSATIVLDDSNGGSSLILNNSGTVNGGALGTAISIASSNNSATINNSGSGSITGAISIGSNSTTITNSDSATISGAISATTGDLDIVNTAGTITGDITLGSNSSSSLTVNNGSVVGNVLMNNATQNLTFSGTGTLTGTIDGAGIITMSDNTVINGNIGASTALTAITIAAGQTLNADENNNSINATNISIAGSGATLRMGTGALTGTIDGSSANQGRVTFFLDSTNTTINSTLGSTNGLSIVSFTSTSGTTSIANNLKAQTVNVLGTSATLSLNSSRSITGNVSVGSGNTFTLNNGSSVTGDIKGASSGVGTVSIANSATVSGAGDFGTSSLKLAALNLVDSSTLTMASSKIINATAITLGASSSLNAYSYVTGAATLNTSSNLNLNDGSYLTGTINGSSANLGSVNTNGLAIVLAPIGTTNAISAINVASGSQARIGNSDSSHANIIKANNINVTGQLDLLDATTITGNVTMLGSSSKINTSGYSQSISGNFTTASSSTIITSVHTSSSADLITVAGVATLNANTKLYVSISGGSTAVGSTYTILSGGSGSSISAISDSNISIDGNGSNKSGAYAFHTSVSGNNLILSVASSETTLSSSSSQAVYNSIGSNPTGNLLTFKNYVDSASTIAAEEAVKSASPQTDNSNNRTAIATTSASMSTAEIRMAELSGSGSIVTAAATEKNLRKKLGLTANDAPVYQERKETPDHGMWMKAFGSSANQSNGATNGQGFNSNSGGFAIGADNKIDELSIVGVNFSVANSRIKSSDDLKKTNVDTYQLNLYGGHSLGKYYLNGILGAAQSEYYSTRVIPSVSQIASANYSGQTYVALVKGGRGFVVTPKINFTPEITITAMRNVVDNYTEEGAGNLSLAVQNKPANFFENRLGAILDYTTSTSKKTKIRSAIKMSYGYDWVGAQQSTTANFIDQASSFTAQGTKVDKRSIKMGVGIDIYRLDNITLSAEYTYEYKYIYHANSASALARYSF